MERLDSIAKRLLLASERHPAFGSVVFGLVLFVLAQVVLFALFGGIPNDLLAAIAVELLLLLAGAAIPLVLLTIAFRRIFARVAELSQVAQSPSRAILLDHLDRTLRLVRDQLGSLQSGTGLSLSLGDMDEVSGWIPTFFSGATGPYVGLDATLPSDYLGRLDPFLRHLDEYRPGVRLRIVTAPTEDLEEDLRCHPEAVDHLQEMHDAWGARLLFMDREEVRVLAEKHRLPGSLVDLALWEGDYCLLWEWGMNQFTVRLCYSDDPTYDQVMALVAAVEEAAVPLACMRDRLRR